jgi:hypothetical protein
MVLRWAVSLILLLASAAGARDDASRCERAIERGARQYTAKLFVAIDRCTRDGSGPVAACLDTPVERERLDAVRARWGRKAASKCDGVPFASTLGYLDTCGAPPSGCTFPSAALDVDGPRNDLVDCLACRLDEHLRSAAVLAVADRPLSSPCQAALGENGIALTRLVVTEVQRCLRRGEADSIAGCLAGVEPAARLALGVAEWRDGARAECDGVDPFVDLGYARLCSGSVPVSPPSCGQVAPPCTFVSATALDQTGDDNDLLDCLECQLVEAGLGVARTIHGAEICCTTDGCGAVRTRAACHAAGGTPAYYRLDSIAAGTAFSPHGIAAGADGSLYVADTGGYRINVRRPDGTIAVLGSTPGAPFGIAVDQGGNVYAALRRSNTVVRVAADGTTTPFAGTGQGTHSGDGGPAVDATITAPNGVAVDPQGNVYMTESGITAFILYGYGGGSGERVRVVDTSGTIHAFAGNGGYTFTGIGGPALMAGFGAPYQLAMTAEGGVLVGEVGFQRVLRVDPDGILRHVAGRTIFTLNGVGAYSGDGGPAIGARLYGAEGLASDSEGRTFIADMRNSRVRMVDARGGIITIAGTGLAGFTPSPDGMPGPLVSAGCPGALAVGPDGRVYYPDLYTSAIRMLTLVPY